MRRAIARSAAPERAEPSTGRARLSRSAGVSAARRRLAAALSLVIAIALPAPVAAGADVQVAAGLRAETVVSGVPRPIQLTLDSVGRLVILSHGWRGEAAAEVYRFDLAALPLDAARAPRVVIPFSEEPRKVALGSLAVDPRSGDLFLGEENGNRIYRLTAHERLAVFGVGLNHLVGGSSLAFDARGRLAVLDFAGPEVQHRAEAPPPRGLDSLADEAYQGPLVLRVDPGEELPAPRRLDLVVPVFPRPASRRPSAEPLFRLISVAADAASGDLYLLSAVGEVFVLGDAGLRRLARLPAGHYHRTHMAVGPDGSVFVSTGFHIRTVYRIFPAGAVSVVARELGDPGGIAVDRSGRLYVAEGALHRIIRIGPAADR
jgi:hypothetical protein